MAFKGAFNGKGGAGIGAVASGEMDWICRMCRERNFARRGDCFKCRQPRTADAELVQAPSMTAPANGTTLTGMVKSYNKKGFGFIMVFGHNSPDVFYTRENVSQRLMHPDMPGEQVTFELFRERGKLIAKNIRPLGDDIGGQSKGGNKGMIGAREAISRHSMDDGQWKCPFCSEHNFARRLECFKCKIPKQSDAPAPAAAGFSSAPILPPPRPAMTSRKTFSPHAGARAIKEAMLANRAGGKEKGGTGRSSGSSSSSSKEKRQTKKKSRKRSSSSRSSSSSKKKRKKGKRKRSSSSRSSSSVVVEKSAEGLAASCGGNTEIDKAKADALLQLTRLQAVEPKEVRQVQFRALLREWHPDKNPDRVELATAVFQFLQKGKVLMAL